MHRRGGSFNVQQVVEVGRRVSVAMGSTMRCGCVAEAGGGGRHGVLHLAMSAEKGA